MKHIFILFVIILTNKLLPINLLNHIEKYKHTYLFKYSSQKNKYLFIIILSMNSQTNIYFRVYSNTVEVIISLLLLSCNTSEQLKTYKNQIKQKNYHFTISKIVNLCLIFHKKTIIKPLKHLSSQ